MCLLVLVITSFFFVKGKTENIRAGSGSPTKRMVNNLVNDISSNGSVSGVDDVRYSGNPNMWRTWSRERAGLKDMEFEGQFPNSKCTY